MHTTVCTLEAQRTDKLADSGLCFHHEALLDQTQAAGLGTTSLLLSHLTGPQNPFSEQKRWVGGALFYT